MAVLYFSLSLSYCFMPGVLHRTKPFNSWGGLAERAPRHFSFTSVHTVKMCLTESKLNGNSTVRTHSC